MSFKCDGKIGLTKPLKQKKIGWQEGFDLQEKKVIQI